MSRPSHSMLPAQRGSAAVEFALAFPLVFLLLYGLLTYGSLFYTQVTVARAVHDGARAAALLPAPAANQPRDYNAVRGEIVESLAGSLIAPLASNASLTQRRQWLNDNVRNQIVIEELACPGAIGGTCARIQLPFPYSTTAGTRLLPNIELPLIGGTGSWVPSILRSEALIRL